MKQWRNTSTGRPDRMTPLASSPRRGRVARRPQGSVTPPASSPTVRRRMQATRRKDTPPELAVRRLLHAMGLRYRVDARPSSTSRRRADVVFRRAKVALFVDGCFWHGSPEHDTWPQTNRSFWRTKIMENIARDRDTDAQLKNSGWEVIRVWEHDDSASAANAVARTVRLRLRSASDPRRGTP